MKQIEGLGKKKKIDFYQNCLQDALPKNLSMVFKVTKYKKGVLYLSTSSNALAHKLKLLSKKLTTQINKQLSEESKITQIKINLLLINPETKRINIEFGQVAIKKMSNFYMRLYDFFHAIADVFWKKYVDSIKKRAKQDHGSKKIIFSRVASQICVVSCIARIAELSEAFSA